MNAGREMRDFRLGAQLDTGRRVCLNSSDLASTFGPSSECVQAGIFNAAFVYP
jgi:hypothetical protein